MQIYLESYEVRDGVRQSGYEHAAGHRLVRCALKDVFGINCKDADGEWERMLSYGPSGKPYRADFSGIHFNITHTAGLIACAVSGGPVGIDAERIRDFPEAVFRRFDTAERDFVSGSADMCEAFMRVWTMKEACVKLTGEGIAAFDRTECIPGDPLKGITYRQFVWQGSYVVTAMEYDL